MVSYKIKSHAKINLALNVTGKTNFLHKIESIISFINLHDLIYIKEINKKNHKIFFKGKFSKNINKINTVTILLKLLDQKKYLSNRKFEIRIVKNIPKEAGMGGGSMNAASLISFFIKKKMLKLSKNELIKLTNKIGSDVILGIKPTNTILSSNGKIKRFDKNIKLYALIVKPNFGCSTKKIYSQVKKFTKPRFNIISKRMFSVEFLKKMKNDLEPIALNTYPKLSTLKNFLKKLSKIEFVRMTGSGSAIIAYFNSDKKCKEAEKKVKKKFRNYWCKTAKTI